MGFDAVYQWLCSLSRKAENPLLVEAARGLSEIESVFFAHANSSITKIGSWKFQAVARLKFEAK